MVNITNTMFNDRKKLGMVSADLQNHSECRGRLQGRLVKLSDKPHPRWRKLGSKMDTMMMICLKKMCKAHPTHLYFSPKHNRLFGYLV